VLIFLFVKRETKASFYGLLASSLFAASFGISKGWFDLARVDSLFLLFLLAALYLIRFKESARSYVFAGVCIGLAFLTKPSALLISLPVMAYCLVANRHLALYFIGTTLALIGISSGLLDWLYHGWYFFYLFLSRHLPIFGDRFLPFWTQDLMFVLPVACALAVFYLTDQRLHGHKKNLLFYLLTTLAVVGTSWLSRLHVGGAANCLLPTYAILSLLFGLALHAALGYVQDLSVPKRSMMEMFVYLVCIFQFGSLLYDPFGIKKIPTHEDVRHNKEFIATLMQIKGDVFSPSDAYSPFVAGKKDFAHWGSISGITACQQGPWRALLRGEIAKAIREKRFGAIVIDPFRCNAYLKDLDLEDILEANYKRQKTVTTSRSLVYIYTPKG
jgi:hypothetical protein